MTNTGQWRITLGLTMLFALILGVGMIFFPETPRYEVRLGKVGSARRTMAKLYGVPETHPLIIQEMEEIQEQLEEMNVDQKWHEFLTAPRMAFRIVLGMVMQAFQQLTGTNFFLYYGTTVFKNTGLSDSFVTQCILGAINFGCTFGGLYIVDHYGRRRSLILGGSFMFCMFIIWSSIGQFDFQFLSQPDKVAPGKGLIVVTAFFIAAYAVTWGPMVCLPSLNLQPLIGSLLNKQLPLGLGNHSRNIPNEVPRKRHGPRHSLQLALELPHQLLHPIHRRQNSLRVRLRFRRLPIPDGCDDILLPHRVAG